MNEDATMAGAPEAPIECEEDYHFTIRNQRGTDEMAGTFRFRALERPDEHKIGVMVGRLVEGVPLDSVPLHVQANSLAIAVVLVGCVSAPPWFQLTPEAMLRWEPEVVAVLARKLREHSREFQDGCRPAGGPDAFRRNVPGGVVATSTRRRPGGVV